MKDSNTLSADTVAQDVLLSRVFYKFQMSHWNYL